MFSLLFMACSIYNIVIPEAYFSSMAIEITEYSELGSFGERSIEFFNKTNIRLSAREFSAKSD